MLAQSQGEKLRSVGSFRQESLSAETASSRRREDFLRSLDQLLGSAREHQVVVVHVDSDTIGEARQGEQRVGER